MRYVALLRGINVGRHRRISMGDLRGVFEELGLDDVSTYLLSGNVLFASGLPAARLTARLERAIAEELAPGVSILLRTKRELAKVAAANPFGSHDVSTLHVTFLEKRPSAARARTLDPELGAPDEFRLLGKEIYLRYPHGYGRSKLTNAYFEKQLGVAATTRNWKTVTALAELAGG
jgi:uncharacterized protein (DUF1697 family)